MAVINYLNFDLQVESTGQDYRAHVLSSPAGEAEARFRSPFSEGEIERFFAQASETHVRRADVQMKELVKDFGQRLFEAVFTEEVLVCFRRSFDQAQEKEMGLRLRLRLKNVPELAALPWEYLYQASSNRPLVLSKKTPVVRYLDLPEPPPPLRVTLPINVLVMISSPLDYPQLNADQEWFNLKAAFHKLESKGLVRVERLEEATLAQLQKKLQEHEFHIFHFIGHGNFDQETQEGVLIFEDEEGKGRAESGQQVATILHDHATLRLAVINACMTATGASSDPFAGLAQSLIQQGLPAVIAMLFPVQDDTAVTFTDNFYYFLTDGYPLEAALAETRKAIFAKGNVVEWGTPVLFMRSPDGHLFDFPAPALPPNLKIQPLATITLEPVESKPPFLRRSLRFMSMGAAFMLSIVLSLAWPSVKKIVSPKNTPEQKHLVVLPFDNVGNDPENQAFCDGLMETLTCRLSQLELFSERTLWVVPASEVRNTKIVTVEAARRSFGVNLALTVSLQRDERQVYLTLNLVNAKNLRQINSATISEKIANLSAIPDEIVIQAAELLEMNLQAQQQRLLQAGGTKVSAAYEAYSKARGFMLNYREQEGNLDAALASFRQALAEDSLYALAYAGLGEAYWRKYEKSADRQWIEPAESYCRHALALNESLTLAHVTLGEIYNGTGQYEQALAVSQRALKIDSVQADGHRLQARAYENLGRLAEAEAAYKKSIHLRRDYWQGYNNLGVFYYLQGRNNDAVAQFERVVALTPENVTGYNNLGGIYSFLERYDEARMQFERSLEIQPNYGAYSNLGTMAFNEGRFAEAAQRYEHALALDSLDYQVWGNLADAYYWTPATGDSARKTYHRAVQRAEEKLKINPRDAELLADMAGYCTRLGQRNRALSFIKRALHLAPDNVVVMAYAGLIYEETGRRELALEWLDKALQKGYALSEIEHEPGLRKLRGDDRFQQIVARHHPTSEN